MSTIIIDILDEIEYNNTHTKAITHLAQRSKQIMKNIKVNYTDADGKRTSTTINGNICWSYFKTINRGNNDIEKGLIKEIQDFVNSIKLSSGCLDKSLIEDLLLNHIMSNEFERGIEAALQAKSRAKS